MGGVSCVNCVSECDSSTRSVDAIPIEANGLFKDSQTEVEKEETSTVVDSCADTELTGSTAANELTGAKFTSTALEELLSEHSFIVTLDRSNGQPLGMVIRIKKDTQLGAKTLNVVSIASEGLVSDWNASAPANMQVLTGMRIIQVNGISDKIPSAGARDRGAMLRARMVAECKREQVLSLKFIRKDSVRNDYKLWGTVLSTGPECSSARSTDPG
eukprot:gnl/TRDRNA2_/TRDRNA2_139277_c0_seq1.p1 gnl/TRDRNA2_/TRDRNA2_139277_c0~~gnl/TRDRNA2_/TRDRNA2_139277_c0_seq1.p1  ORF type:complete len:215 (+),score=35.71 gnl/TRDRNA2_/TRDRNA2_139277_c0_seq1:75-719(+)